MCWSDIPIELLAEINKRLDLVDVIRSGAVCSWWSSIPYKDKYVPKPQIPWLMLSSKDNPSSRYFYSLTEKKTYEFNLPDIAGQHCTGSCHGYLISIDNNANLVATNPLAPGSHIPLLPTSSFAEFTSLTRDSSGRILEYEWNDEFCETSFFVDDYYKKAILSPDRKIVVVITIKIDGSTALARTGDESWTELQAHGDIVDIIFHKGHLYALNLSKGLFIFNLDRMSRQILLEECCLVRCGDKRYLVASPCGGKLFMVARMIRPTSDVGAGLTFRTRDIEVFELDEDTYTWKQVYTLGELSFFVGFNYSMSLRACDFPGLKKNCIYFTEDYKEYYIDKPEKAGDNGVFNLDDGSVTSLYDDVNLDQLNWPPPIWFLPTIF